MANVKDTKKLKVEDVTFDQLYNSLTELDEKCRERDASTLTPHDYLENAMLMDIASNLKVIMLNENICGLGSPGIDLNCRSLMETIAILIMLEKGEISDQQLEIFRASWVFVEKGNEKSMMAIPEEEKIAQEYIEKYTKVFNCTEKELRYHSKQPYFFLKNGIKDKPFSFEKIIKDMIGKIGQYSYKLFGLLIHPHCIDESLYEFVNEKRNASIKAIKNYVVDILINNGYITANKESKYKQYISNPYISANLEAMDYHIAIFSKLNNQATLYKNGEREYFLYRHLGDLICLFRDMSICQAFGMNEQLTSKFKIFIESASYFEAIQLSKTKEEFNAKADAAYYAFVYQIYELGNIMSEGNKSKYKANEGIKDLYVNYYSKKDPGLKNFKQFEKAMIKNSLYFLNCNHDQRYLDLVKTLIESIWKEKSNRVKELYNISIDLGHSCGYILYSSPQVFDGLTPEIMEVVSYFLLSLFVKIKESNFSAGILLDSNPEICELAIHFAAYSVKYYQTNNTSFIV